MYQINNLFKSSQLITDALKLLMLKKKSKNQNEKK